MRALPLGFLALAGGTLLVSALQLEWLQAEEGHQVAVLVLAFVVPLQLVASVFGFVARDVVAGAAMGLLAGTWLSVALITLLGEPGTTSDPLGLLLFLSAVALLVPALTAGRDGRLEPVVVLSTTALRFAATGAYQVTAASEWKTAAGVLGLVLCAVAIAAALRLELTVDRATTA